MSGEFAISTLELKSTTILTLATGVITVTQGYHAVAAETGTADDLATINIDAALLTSFSGSTYRPFVLLIADTGDTITLKHGTGNIYLNGAADFAMNGNEQVLLHWNGTNWSDVGMSAAGGAGETNTASNQGVAGVGVWKQKTGVDLEFKNINAGSAKITVTDDTGNNEIDIDVAEAQIDHGTIGGLGDDDHTQYALVAGDTYTGVHDFGGATSVEIPNGAAPTVNAAGEIAIDTTITDHTGAIKIHDGVEELVVIGMPTANLTAVDTHVISYNAANNEFEMAAQTGGAGEANTASNVGVGGVGVFKQKTGVDLEFKNIIADSAKITVTEDVPNNEIGLDLGTVNFSDLNTKTHTHAAGSGDQITPATAFATTVTHELGGLEADVSAYAGLVAISGGATAEVNSKAELETQIADVADFAEADGDAYTGAHDFGGADSLEIPNSATPTVNATGELALDTTITDHKPLMKYYSGTEEMTVLALPTANLDNTDQDAVLYDAATDAFVMSPVSGSGWDSGNYVILRDVKAQNTGGGGSTTGGFETRTLNEETDPNGLCTLTSNQFVLTAGDYLVIGEASNHNNGLTSSRIYNVTGATTLSTAGNARAYGLQSCNNKFFDIFTVAASQTLELQSYPEKTTATNGYGKETNWSEEVYSDLMFLKVG